MYLLLYSVSILIHIFTTTTIRAQQDPTYIYCSTTSNYTSGSQFEANLNSTLQSLTINTPTNNRLYNTSIEGTNDKVYGLAQCRGDLSSQSCQTCLDQSRLNIIKRCSKGKQAAIRYDGCLLRYSDEFFFDKVVNYRYVMIYVLQNMTEPDLFNENLSSLLSEVSQTVSANVSRFSVGATKYEEFFNIYAMGQCMEDLLEGDCYNCLVDLVGVLQATVPATKKEAKILTASCFLWYSTDLFFSLQSLPSPPPSPSPSIVASSPTPTLTNRTTGNGMTKRSRSVVYVVLSVVISLIVFLSVCLCLWRRKAYKKFLSGKARDTENTNSLLFDFDTLRVATDDFSDSNKLGEGGFGPVYKGRLPDGGEIAVKMLASGSGQGLEELRNEVVFIAKLQHRNLVRLRGFCLGEEKMLVYEYLPNTSLDKFLFDPVKRELLNWEIRYKIIEGIGRGLLYLHEDSQLRIIHRDLKASNILLDGDMNPKISDFGLAKLFGLDQTQGNASRIAGTYGYMPPEYAVGGQYSMKSDVFSFGILVLEIVTGRKNSSFADSESGSSIGSHAWRHWTKGTALRLVDCSLGKGYSKEQALRCIQLGLLCIQNSAADRPFISSVVLMLECQSVTLGPPSKPAFLVQESSIKESEIPIREVSRVETPSVNEVTMTEMEPR
ncbi:Cysteine-rich receptor-like protein kinase 10 [Acorus gramineus]|uniref:Cysteine-rich receptor-like protein kinase 10 n=1 Tax=Acorus gramineus TaxID=55184 RepID=A0AAV9BW13_ACOGR|nr:Cysteine-rich receptor-like protein kinase 10 [Acorus gramineus]